MRARAGGWGLAAASMSLAVATAHAQVVTDGSLGLAGSVPGPNFYIAPTLGQMRGGNLFHSFSTFNINSQQSVFFDGAPGLVNIVARVTGNTPSIIDGLVSASANLYLLNPRGILFGANAAVDVAGSLHASTADYIRFANGERFHASLGTASSLSIATPVAFGFVDGIVAPITASGSVLVGAAGSALTFTGGAVTFDDTLLSVEQGTIAVVGVRSTGEVVLAGDSFDTSSFTAMADVRMRGTLVNVFDEESTSVYIRGGRFVLEDASLVTATTTRSGLAPRVIDIDVDSLQLSNAAIATVAMGDGLGTPIRIRADDISVGATAAVTAIAAGSRVGGDIDVQTGSLTINGGETIDTGFSLFGTGSSDGAGGAGNVNVHATTVDITGGGLSAVTASAGDGGDITLVADRVSLHGGAVISAGATSSGNGGRVSVIARELLVDAGASALAPAITVTTNAIGNDAGDAGTIEIQADDLRLRNGRILSSTTGTGNGGAIDITAQRALLEQSASIASDTGILGAFGPTATHGSGGAIRLQTDSLEVLSGSRLSADTLGTGTGGTIAITADSFLIDSTIAPNGVGSSISANTGSVQDPSATAAGGNVLISADTVTMRNGATISANAYGTGIAGRITIDGGTVDIGSGSAVSTASFGQAAAAGDANDITIAAREVSLRGTGQLTTATHGPGAAGRLRIESDVLTLATGGLLQSSSLSVAANAGAVGDILIDSDRVVIDDGSINARSAGGGGPGSIALLSDSILMMNGAVISAVSTGSSDAGNIGISALDTLELQGFSRITTEAQLAAGGNIALIVGNRLFAHDSTISTSVLGGSANGGNILIDPILVLLDNSAIVARAVGGNGGAIDIATQLLLRSASSVIDASSELGIDGRIGIIGFDADLNSDIAPLPSDFLNAQQWLSQPCASRLGTDVSRFTVAGRDGAYRSPLDYMPSPLTFDTLELASMPSAGVFDAESFNLLQANTRCR
jgi:filamentous hemagglutinin family protein